MTAAAAPDTRLTGIALRCAAAGLFAVQSSLLKLASGDHVSAPEMLLYRALFGLPLVVAWVLVGPGLAALRTERPLAHLGRSALGISGILCTFQAIVMLPLADASTLGFTAPIFATILSALLLKELVGPHRRWAVLAGFVGVAIVMRPGSSGHAVPLAGVAIALLSAFLTACVTITLRRLGNTEHVAAIVFWFFVCSVVVGLALLPWSGSTHLPRTWLLLVLAGLAGGSMQICMTASLQHAPVSALAPFDYLQIVGMLLLGWLLLAELPTVNTLAGATVIAASGVYVAVRERRLHIASTANSVVR